MEKRELDIEWKRIRQFLKQRFGKNKLPDMNAVLFLIGVQELGRLEKEFSKEAKQDLMHIAICRLLSEDGFFEYKGRDEEGWPQWKSKRPFNLKGLKEQEDLLKIKVIDYFKALDI